MTKCGTSQVPKILFSYVWCSKYSSSSSLSQFGVGCFLGIPPHQWEGILPLQWHRGPPYLPTFLQARKPNPPTLQQKPKPTSTPSSPLQVRLSCHRVSTLLKMICRWSLTGNNKLLEFRLCSISLILWWMALKTCLYLSSHSVNNRVEE